MTHRINPFLWLSELNFFNMTQGNEPFFFQIWLKVFSLKKSKNWMFFFSIFLKELIFLWLEGLDFFLRRKELNPFSVNMTQRIELSSYATQRIEPSSYLPQRIELFFWIWLKELNLFFCMTHRIEPLFLRRVTHRIEPFLFFLIMTQRIELFFNMTQRIEPLFEYDAKNRTRFFFFEYDSMNRSHFFLIWLNELNLIWHDSKNWFFFFEKMTQRNEISWAWRKELNPFF